MRILRAILYLFGAGALVWSVYWGAAAGAVRWFAADVRAGQGFGAISWGFDPGPLGGYPDRFSMALGQPHLEIGAGFRWQSDALNLSAASFAPNRIAVDLSEPHQFTGRFGSIRVESAQAEALVLLRRNLRLSLDTASVAFASLQMSGAEGGAVALEALSLQLRADAEYPQRLAFSAALAGLDLAALYPGLAAEYQRIPAMRLNARLELAAPIDIGMLSEGVPAPLALDGLDLRFVFGQTEVALSGQIGFNAAGMASGEVSVTLHQWRPLIAFLIDVGFLEPGLEAFLVEQFEGLASQSEDPASLRLPLRIADGLVMFGMYRIGLIPPLD